MIPSMYAIVDPIITFIAFNPYEKDANKKIMNENIILTLLPISLKGFFWLSYFTMGYYYVTKITQNIS